MRRGSRISRSALASSKPRIFCGYCVESCPTDAITYGHGFELATYDINALIYRKEQLLEKSAGPQAAS